MRSVLPIILVALVALNACKTKPPAIEGAAIPGKSSAWIQQNMVQNESDFEWFKGKMATRLYAQGENNSFKTSVRIRRDSLIWLSVTFSNFLIAQAVITTDSVKVILKREKKYFEKDIDWINQMYGLELDYYLLQDLLMGNAVGYDESNKYKALEDTMYYVLSTHTNKKLSRVRERSPRNEEDLLFLRYWLYPDNFRPYRIQLDDIADTSSIIVTNTEFEHHDGFLHPGNIELSGSTPTDSINLQLRLVRASFNEPTSFPYNIGDNYEKLE